MTLGNGNVWKNCQIIGLTPAPEDTIGYIWQYMHTNMTDEQMRLVKRFQTVEEEVGQQKG